MAGWNQATLDYLDSIKGLGDKQLKAILDEASDFVKKGKRQENLSKPKSSRSILHSDNEESGSELVPHNSRGVIHSFKLELIISIADNPNTQDGNYDDMYD